MILRRLFLFALGGALMTVQAGLLAGDDQPAATPADASRSAAEAEIEKNLGLPLSELEKAYAGRSQPESVRMLLAVAKGSMMGSGDGWFGPAAQRYTWDWLAARHGVSEGEAITAENFQGPAHWFARLDRNKDGRILPEDLDWSDRNPWVQQSYLVNRLLRRMDPNGDGKLTRDEWQAFFDKASGGKEQIVSEDLRDVILSGLPGSFLPGDAPSQDVLIRGLFAGELGSLSEGPALDTQAPDFALKTHDGSRTIRLGDVIGKKPVVLTFGNFTCGPFRALFPGVEQVYQRFGDEAVFVAVYVREAHPTDGWKMDSNARVGVAVAQPKTYGERVAVATQCHQLLKPTMPLLVDEINDPVGNAYSGMPARSYVIDLDGKVAYKGGRGPFGFKSGEMEQALVMTLLDRKSKSVEPAAPATTGGAK